MANPTNCPQCGAAIKAALDATRYQCPYCQQNIALEGPPRPPPPAGFNQGGFNQGGFNQGGIPQIVVIQRPTPSPIIYSGGGFGADWTIRMVIFGVVMLLSAGGWGFRRWHHGVGVGADLAGLGGGVWDGTTPLSCGGNDNVTASGINVSFTAGTAIYASGNCTVTCTNCTLRAPTAVEATGNGDVKLINCNVTGSQASVAATGNGSVEALGNTTVNGPVRQSGNGHVTGITPPAAAPQAAAPPPAVHAPVQPVIHPAAPVPPPPPRRR